MSVLCPTKDIVQNNLQTQKENNASHIHLSTSLERSCTCRLSCYLHSTSCTRDISHRAASHMFMRWQPYLECVAATRRWFGSNQQVIVGFHPPQSWPLSNKPNISDSGAKDWSNKEVKEIVTKKPQHVQPIHVTPSIFLSLPAKSRDFFKICVISKSDNVKQIIFPMDYGHVLSLS